MIRRLIAFALVTTCLVPAAVMAAEVPPASLHQVGDHWTAWDPPTTLPPDTEVYTIESGDTLWSLAARFYDDPYLWPQLWERNQYILDAHWIYPGDPLVVGMTITPAEDMATVDLGEDGGEGGLPGAGGAGGAVPDEEPVEGVLDKDIAAGQPQPLGTESDIYCSGFIGEREISFPHYIIGSEHQALASTSVPGEWEGQGDGGVYGSAETLRYGMSTGDILYVDGGREAGMSPGSLFTVVEVQDLIRHPISRKVMGRHYHYTGRVRILSVQETSAIGEIVFSCDPVTVGSALQPFTPEPVPLARRGAQRPVNLPPAAERLAEAPIILGSPNGLVALGQDSVVYIDRGLDDDVTPGDIYSIYRLHRKNLPPVLVGELAVLAVHEGTSVARITQSRYTVYLGDRLEHK